MPENEGSRGSHKSHATRIYVTDDVSQLSSKLPSFSDNHLVPFHKVVRGAELVGSLEACRFSFVQLNLF